MIARVLRFAIELIGGMVALYRGYATPSESSGLARCGRRCLSRSSMTPVTGMGGH